MRQIGKRREIVVEVRDYVILALGYNFFSEILNGLQVVSDRNDREQEQDEDCHGGELHPSARAFPWGMALPQPHKDDRQHCPDEIEGNLHSQPQFYMTGFEDNLLKARELLPGIDLPGYRTDRRSQPNGLCFGDTVMRQCGRQAGRLNAESHPKSTKLTFRGFSQKYPYPLPHVV